MELLTLNSSYQPAEMVERYSSLIWTERYSTAGDFQLVTTDVERMLKLLPLESLVTLRESTVPMIVEVHKIEKGIDGAPTLTVTGRSFDSVLERRVALSINPQTGTRVAWIIPAIQSSDAAYHAMRKICGDEIDRRNPPIESELDRQLLKPILVPSLSPDDYLPMLDFPLPSDFVYVEPTNTTATYQHEIKPGDLYSVVRELLGWNHHGLKAVRPVLGGPSKIGIEIYNGADLTDTVVFDVKFDQFEDTTYLLSFAGSTNEAYVVSKTGFEQISKTQTEALGLERRVQLVDISSEEGVDTPEARRTRALVELYKYNVTALFDGQLSGQIASKYNSSLADGQGYSLGDLVKLNGEYGLSKTVRVSEFIRSDDATGSRAYPTFEEVL